MEPTIGWPTPPDTAGTDGRVMDLAVLVAALVATIDSLTERVTALEQKDDR